MSCQIGTLPIFMQVCTSWTRVVGCGAQRKHWRFNRVRYRVVDQIHAFFICWNFSLTNRTTLEKIHFGFKMNKPWSLSVFWLICRSKNSDKYQIRSCICCMLSHCDFNTRMNQGSQLITWIDKTKLFFSELTRPVHMYSFDEEDIARPVCVSRVRT